MRWEVLGMADAVLRRISTEIGNYGGILLMIKYRAFKTEYGEEMGSFPVTDTLEESIQQIERNIAIMLTKYSPIYPDEIDINNLRQVAIFEGWCIEIVGWDEY